MFSNSSRDILGIMGHALDLLGLKWSIGLQQREDPKHHPYGAISIAQKGSVAVLGSFVGAKR